MEADTPTEEHQPPAWCDWFGPEATTGPGSDLWIAYHDPHWYLYRATTQPTQGLPGTSQGSTWTLLFKGDSWMAAEDARTEQTITDLENQCST